MMERVFYGFLYFAGWCISTCLLHQYHYVAGPLNWTEAQTYCRKTYTDLATIRSHEEMNQLFRTVSSAGVKSADVWTGLYSKIDWKWSNGYRGDGAEYKNWNNNPDNEPDFYGAAQFCVCAGNDGRWWDDGCDKKHPFICITGTESEFVFVNENMNWSDAQKHCREKYADLATVRNVTENTKIRILVPSKKWAWIGLFRDTNMYWSDGSDFTDLSVSTKEVLGSKRVICVFATMKSAEKLWFTGCDKRLGFVCYGPPPPAPVKRQVVKLRIKSSVDLNDPDVKANMLRKVS
ncbi:Neurocan core protein, partial [Nibea albiflora]